MTTQTITYRCPHCQQPVDVDLRPENELLVCPNEGCGKPFKVDIPKAQPLEGIIMPNGTDHSVEEATPIATTPAAPVAVPPSEVPEEPVKTVRVAMVRRYPFRSMGYALLILTGIVAAILLV